jgi:hypothetical protein
MTVNKQDDVVKWPTNCNWTGDHEKHESSAQKIDCKADSVKLMEQGFNQAEAQTTTS